MSSSLTGAVIFFPVLLVRSCTIPSRKYTKISIIFSAIDTIAKTTAPVRLELTTFRCQSITVGRCDQLSHGAHIFGPPRYPRERLDSTHGETRCVMRPFSFKVFGLPATLGFFCSGHPCLNDIIVPILVISSPAVISPPPFPPI